MNTCNTYITSDLHLGHNQPFVYEPRGFSSIEEHDAAIIENINKVVGENDTLYILGDLMLNDNESKLPPRHTTTPKINKRGVYS